MKKISFGLRLVVLALVLTLLLPAVPSQAASTFPITPQNVTAGANVDYCIEIYTPGIVTAGTTMEFGFPADFDLSGLSLAACTGGTNDGTLCSADSECTGGGTCTDESAPATDSEVSIWTRSGFVNRTNCTTGTERIAEASGGADEANRDIVELSGTENRSVKFILEDAIAAGTWAGFKFTAKSGDSVLAASTDGIHTMSFTAIDGDTQTLLIGLSELLYVGDSNLVNISASVDPTLSLTLGDWSSGVPNTCPLGTFDATKISTCSYSVKVVTNAYLGFTSYITSSDGLVSGSDEINAVADGAVTAGSEEYGVATDGSNLTDIQSSVTCPASGGTTAVSSTGLTTGLAQSLTTSTSPVDGGVGTGKQTVCHAASISPITPAGTYSQDVTITVIGNF